MRVNVLKLRSGMLLDQWSARARAEQAHYANLQQGPLGAWSAMVLTNEEVDPSVLEGFTVHTRRVDVFFWNDTGGVHFETFYWPDGTRVEVLE